MLAVDAQRVVPDGLGEEHLRPGAGWHRHASPLSLVVLGAVVLIGLSGLAGRERDWHASAAGVRLQVHAPEVIRNGEFLEMRIRVDADRAIGQLVIGVEAALWEDLTVNTMVPAPSEEVSRDGEFRFTFAGLEPGSSFLWKADLQVNPDIVLGNEGLLTVYDGETELVATELELTVLP